ncbi:hypothetical protein CYMTET_4492 [Cymbomonas tetramitiformis]|uniref:Protein kinase domain-containing protein n=1 Tax=Cymbomonas tetramitiformis TaxID=36881 RepID=A0AAE0H140_9CHLO|nr:hypothetical protein CYMTET_4492 [Cymbomonas tetramitiformis]
MRGAAPAARYLAQEDSAPSDESGDGGSDVALLGGAAAAAVVVGIVLVRLAIVWYRRHLQLKHADEEKAAAKDQVSGGSSRRLQKSSLVQQVRAQGGKWVSEDELVDLGWQRHEVPEANRLQEALHQKELGEWRLGTLLYSNKSLADATTGTGILPTYVLKAKSKYKNMMAIKAVFAGREGVKFTRHDRMRLQREATAMQRVHHTNVARCTDFHIDPSDSLVWFVLELVDGRTLAEVIAESAPLTEVYASRLAIQILNGLQAIHDAKLIHRDIKPANIFVLGDVAAPSVKIIDFGVVAHLDVNSSFRKSVSLRSPSSTCSPAPAAPAL